MCSSPGMQTNRDRYTCINELISPVTAVWESWVSVPYDKFGATEISEACIVQVMLWYIWLTSVAWPCASSVNCSATGEIGAFVILSLYTVTLSVWSLMLFIWETFSIFIWICRIDNTWNWLCHKTVTNTARVMIMMTNRITTAIRKYKVLKEAWKGS